jgi:hypothetical protein
LSADPFPNQWHTADEHDMWAEGWGLPTYLELASVCGLQASIARDLVLMNQYQFNRGDATVLGTSDIDAYVVVGPEGPYRRLDRASWDTIDEFRTCDELLASIFAAQNFEDER